MGTSFRVSFTDVDSSFGLNLNDSPIKGYMVVRAPKGNATPTYFPAGSATKITQLVGVPSVKYPNIQDALDYNAQFGLWISSPAGTSVDYPSYFGGKYLTDYGLFDFYKVSNKDSPNYITRLLLGNEMSIGTTNSTTSRNGVTGAITISDITASTYALLHGIRFTYNGDGIYKGNVVEAILNKSTGNFSIGDEIVGNISFSDPTYTVTFPGTNINVPNFNFADSGAADAYFDTNFPAGFTIEWLLNVRDYTYMYWVQRSPTEEKSYLSINEIGYIQYFTASGAVITSVGHTFSNGDVVRVKTTGTLPSPLAANTNYYVVGVSGNTFGLSSLKGGAPIATTTAGTGTHSIYKEAFVENMVSFTSSEDTTPGKVTVEGTYVGSLISSSVDGYGTSNFIENKVPASNNPFLEVKVIKPFTAPVVIKVTNSTYTITGKRYAAQDSASLSSILQEGWDVAQDDDYEVVNLFMEPSGESSLKTSLANLRSNRHKVSTFIAPILGSTVDELLVNRSSAPSITGLAYYANRFLRRENFTGTTFWSSCIGAIGVKLSKIMQDKLGGWAPMYTDQGGLGGSLPIAIEKQEFKFSNELQQTFDEAGLNLIIRDPFQGPMIIGQKTAQSPANLSDWSYLGHQMAFDSLKREIRDKVLIPQIGKPNNGEFQSIRQVQAESILNRRLQGANKIWTAGIVDAFSGNDDAAKVARKFVLIIKVKVTIFSEFVDLTLQTLAQTVSL